VSLTDEIDEDRDIVRIKKTLVKAVFTSALLAVSFQATAVFAQTTSANDPTIGFDRLFGLAGHTCKQYDDTGRLYLYSEGIPALDVVLWLQRSDNGTKPNVPMPQALAEALPEIPGCLPGKHHAASGNG
jgi:hypothetical protein